MYVGVPALRVQGLSKTFDGQKVLDNVSFSVEKVECLTVVGPSGAGKSILLKSLNRLIEPSEGRIDLFGTDITTIDPINLRRRVCLVGQVPVLFEGTVRQNLAYPFSFKKNQNLARPDFTSVLKSVGLFPSILDGDAGKLSVGQQQRVCIARALCLNPDILLLDEPTASLDHDSAQVVERTIMDLNHDAKLTIVIVTHDMDQASRLGDRTLRIVNGQVDDLASNRHKKAPMSVAGSDEYD